MLSVHVQAGVASTELPLAEKAALTSGGAGTN
jgi:hypothetical protein